MTSPPTREEYLSYVHLPLTNPEGDPPPGSPTKSPMRYRWRELRDWDVEADANAYWDGMSDSDKQSRLTRVPPWEVVRMMLANIVEPFTSEPSLHDPFVTAFRIPHNGAIQGASDAHAEIRSAVSGLDKPPIGNSDLVFVYDNKLTGIIELKTWWNVTEEKIAQVKAGINPVHRELLTWGRYRTLERSSPRTSCS